VCGGVCSGRVCIVAVVVLFACDTLESTRTHGTDKIEG